jgi:sugar lactone lactonase YvrE
MSPRVPGLILCILLSAVWELECISQAHAQAAPPPQTDEIFVVNGKDSIMAYAPGRSGNVAPDWVAGRQLSPYGLARDSAGRIYVTNYWLDSISVFAPNAAGAASPVATIRGSKTGLEFPTGIAVDSKGKIYVVNASGDITNYPTADAKVRVDVYEAGSDGNVAPIAVIQGPRTRLQDPMAVAVDSSGKIYVADSGGADDPDSPARVMVYAAGSNGNIQPIAVISGEKTGLDMSNGIAVDSGGKIYVTNNGSQIRHSDSVTVYPPGAHGNVAPVATIGSVSGPQGIAVDSGGRIFVTNSEDWNEANLGPNNNLRLAQSVRVYPANANGRDVEPVATIQGSLTEMDEVQGIVVSPKGDIYVASSPLSKPGAITIYPANSKGNVKPSASIVDGTDMKLDSPSAIALDSSGRIYVANSESITIYPSGTNHNVPPLLSITGPRQQFINGPDGIAVDGDHNIYLSVMQGGSLNSGVVDVFAEGSDEKAMPVSIITFATAARLPQSIAVDSGRNLYVGLRAGPGGKGSIWIYPPDSHGAAMPIATINGVPAGNIALDSVGRIYVANGEVADSEQGSVEIFPGLTSQGSKPGEPAQIGLSSLPGYPNVKPIATISGAHTGIDHPRAIAFDSAGRIYVLNSQTPGLPGGSGSITIYRPLGYLPTGNLDETPIATIAGPETKLDMVPTGIAVWTPPAR